MGVTVKERNTVSIGSAFNGNRNDFALHKSNLSAVSKYSVGRIRRRFALRRCDFAIDQTIFTRAAIQRKLYIFKSNRRCTRTEFDDRQHTKPCFVRPFKSRFGQRPFARRPTPYFCDESGFSTAVQFAKQTSALSFKP